MTEKNGFSPKKIEENLQNDSDMFSNDEVLLSEQALEKLAQAHAVQPPLSVKDKIMTKINLLNTQNVQKKALDINNLPILTPESNWLDWKETVKDIERPTELENIHLHTLESNEMRDLFLAFVKEMVPEEVHHDLVESFILLDGTCECHIEDENGNKRIVRMREGDYIDFKIGETHDIHITSSQPAIAILQWLKIAA